MYKVAWAALRQIEALRESVAMTLRDGAIDRGQQRELQFYCDWLQDQGVEPVVSVYEPTGSEEIAFLSSMEHFLKHKGINVMGMHLAGQRSRYSEEDVGVSRSGAGWDSLPNFVISSAYVRLLGAMEQFELDVLKALLYYRPEGVQNKRYSKIIEAEVAVTAEQPNDKDEYRKPALWTWIRKYAENNVDRRKILRNVYGIECAPKHFDGRKKLDINRYYGELYGKRNAIAHGRARAEISLSEYGLAEVFALSLIEHVSNQCISIHGVAV